MQIHTVTVTAGARVYNAHIGSGAREHLPALLSGLGEQRRILVIADRTVWRLHSARFSLAPTAVVELVEPGEERKSLSEAARLYDALARAGIGRHDLIVTLGGGMIGDLGGFVAATWNRGVDYIHIPTTLEAAIDAAIGGKTAVNHAAGKNLIGAFHQPVAVVVDIELLETLPERDFVAGLAESVKHAAIRDPAFFIWHEANGDAIRGREPRVVAEMIRRNVEIKAAVVAADEREAGVRAILNYGHTIGHAIELVAGYSLRHGECVGLGILAENAIAVSRGLLARETAERIRLLLERLGLPLRLSAALDLARVTAACHADKKVRAGAIHFQLIRALGEPVELRDVRDDEIAAAVGGVAEA